MVTSLIALAVLGAAAPISNPIPWLELQPAAVRTTSASLLEDNTRPLPQVVDAFLLDDIRLEMTSEMTRFANDMFPEDRASDAAGSGYGDDVGGLALLCGILGFFPGFGIGHLVAGNISGFVLFLVVDIVIAGVFFIVFPVFYFPFWYVASLVAILVERVVEAFLAADSATRYRGYHDRVYGDADSVPGGRAFGSLPQVKPAFTILNF